MSTEKEPIEYPNIVERFREVFQKLGIKKADAYVDHCAKGDLEDLEDIEQKLYEMGLHPSLRNQVVNFWAAEIKQPVPQKLQKRLAEERGAKVRQEGEKEPTDKELELIAKKLQKVKEAGFGEVRIIIRNGVMHRILTTEEKMIVPETKG